MNSKRLLLAVALLVGAFTASVHAMTPGAVFVELKLDAKGCISDEPKILLEAPAWVMPDNIGNYSTKAGVIWLISQVDQNGQPAPKAKRRQDLEIAYKKTKATSSSSECESRTMEHFNKITIPPDSMWHVSSEVSSRDKVYWSANDMSCFGYKVTAPKKSWTEADVDDSCAQKEKDPVIIIRDGGGAGMQSKLEKLLWLLALCLGGGAFGYALYFRARRRLRELS